MSDFRKRRKKKKAEKNQRKVRVQIWRENHWTTNTPQDGGCDRGPPAEPTSPLSSRQTAGGDSEPKPGGGSGSGGDADVRGDSVGAASMGALRTSVTFLLQLEAFLLQLEASAAAPTPPSPSPPPPSCQQKVVRLEAEIQGLQDVISDQHRYIQGLHGSQAGQLQLLPNTHLSTDPLNLYRDCSEVFADGNVASGLYVVRPDGSPSALNVYCDMNNGGGWTVFQRRRNGKESFDRAWVEYKHGFGDLHSPDGEFWLGNNQLHHLTNQGNYDLRINMEDFEGNQRFAEYKNFRVDDEKDQYQLHVGEFTGTAGDALTAQRGPGSAPGSGVRFSTYDQQSDGNTTCIRHSKAGWWFSRCDAGNLNGHYYSEPRRAMAEDGVVWFTWHGWWYSIKSVVMMVRAADLHQPPPVLSHLPGPPTDQQGWRGAANPEQP